MAGKNSKIADSTSINYFLLFNYNTLHAITFQITHKEAGISSRLMRVLDDNVDESMNVFHDYSEIPQDPLHPIRMVPNTHLENNEVMTQL